MMGTALFNLDIPVSKTSSTLLCLSKDEVSKNAPSPCIHCGKCVSVCPIGLILNFYIVMQEIVIKKIF